MEEHKSTDAYIQYSVKELLIQLHTKIDKNQERNDTRLGALEEFKSRAKGAAIVLSILAPLAGAALSYYL